MPSRVPKESPPCYAIVQPGLEELAGEEIADTLRGSVKKTSPEVVVFRVPEIDRSLLRLKTTEDVYVLAWGTDQLTYRAEDLDKIRRWTEREADWPQLLQIHHSIRPKPRGKPTYRLVVQMTGTHVYRRVDARKALAKGLADKLPASWKHAEENASIEIWLTINGATAVCGVRLSDRTMRHRSYKGEHLPASLRPTVAAAMVRLANVRPGQVILDPMCGAGTILAETWYAQPRRRKSTMDEPLPPTETIQVLGGDIDPESVRSTLANLRDLGPARVVTWDARNLPLENESVDRIICNPPFGKQLSTPEEVVPLYRETVAEMNRVLKPTGRAVLLIADVPALRRAVEPHEWKIQRVVNVRVLGQRASIQVYRKPG